LRRLLAKSGEPDAVVTESGGYRLRIAGNTLDARLFETKVSQAEAATAAGEVAKAAALLGSALELWRGPALAGLSGRVIVAAATAWDERRWAVVETYCDRLLVLGNHRQVVTELAAVVASYPMREKAVRHLMLALYRDGRRADALALYQDTRMLLAEELGLDPGPDLQRLQQQILGDDPALTAPGPANDDIRLSTAAWGQQTVPRQPPAAVPHFVGRRDELKSLTALLDIAAPARATQPRTSSPRISAPSPIVPSPTSHPRAPAKSFDSS
jgi:DNA-binding SARP family transcriptional activator